MPATIGLRGNVFGPFGSRLSTAIQTGEFHWSWRPDSLLGQNLIAVIVNSLVAGLGIACAAEVLAVIIGPGVVPIGFGDFIVVSLGACSAVVSIVALGLTVASVRCRLGPRQRDRSTGHRHQRPHHPPRPRLEPRTGRQGQHDHCCLGCRLRHVPGAVRVASRA